MEPASVEYAFAKPVELRPPALGAALKTTTDALRWIREDLQEGYHDAFEDAERLLVAAGSQETVDVAHVALLAALQAVGLLRDFALPKRVTKPLMVIRQEPAWNAETKIVRIRAVDGEDEPVAVLVSIDALVAMELRAGRVEGAPATMVENSWNRIEQLARRKYIISGGDTVVIEKSDLR
jgi:hypothetical protein